jgi:hypothetical protein
MRLTLSVTAIIALACFFSTCAQIYVDTQDRYVHDARKEHVPGLDPKLMRGTTKSDHTLSRPGQVAPLPPTGGDTAAPVN